VDMTDGIGPGSCSLSALALRMLKLWVLLPKRQLYFGDIGCGGDEWNWLRIVSTGRLWH
jgi:hypothetical protein